MEKVFKNGDIITSVNTTGIFKEYDKETDKITFWAEITWSDDPTIELNAVATGIEYFTKATPREEIETLNFLYKEGYIWNDKKGALIDTYTNLSYDIIRKFLIEGSWYINDETGEAFLMKEYISKENGIISVYALIDKDDFIHIDINDFKVDGNWICVKRSEEKKLFYRLSRVGYLWNEVKNELVYVGKYNLSSKEKDKLTKGDFIVDEDTNEILIFKEQDYFTVCGDKNYTSYYKPWASMKLDMSERISVTNEKYSMYSTIRYATLPEINHFLQVLKENGYTWNKKQKELIKEKNMNTTNNKTSLYDSVKKNDKIENDNKINLKTLKMLSKGEILTVYNKIGQIEDILIYDCMMDEYGLFNTVLAYSPISGILRESPALDFDKLPILAFATPEEKANLLKIMKEKGCEDYWWGWECEEETIVPADKKKCIIDKAIENKIAHNIKVAKDIIGNTLPYYAINENIEPLARTLDRFLNRDLNNFNYFTNKEDVDEAVRRVKETLMNFQEEIQNRNK